MAPPLSAPAVSQAAHDSFTLALVPDLPLLMHGSGDVEPMDVDPESVRLLASLTAQYVARLVDAAVDAHDVLTDGAGGLCPPPLHKKYREKSFSKKRSRDGAEVVGGGDDFWDEPLPEPKVKRKTSTDEDVQQINNQYHQHQDQNILDDAPLPQVPYDEWVVLAGVDVFARRRRSPYASVPHAIGTQCFIFPICHDPALYGRVMEIQAARRNLAPMLIDPVLTDMVRDEGVALVRAELGGGGADGNGSPDSAGDTGGAPARPADKAIWPGLEDILPTHRGQD